MPRDAFKADHRAALLERIEALEPGARRRWGAMSPHAAILHMRDALRWAAGELDVAPVRLRVPAWLMRLVALRLPLPWPRGAPTLPELDQGAKPPPTTDFDRDRGELVEALNRFAHAAPVTRPHHPVFGRMSERYWGVWAYRHTDHHLRQFGL